jgi:pyruvate formate lyase activating enzyme
LPEREASLYEALAHNFVRCSVCPHRCTIRPSAKGICGTRINRDGKLLTAIYGHVTSTAVDPIEKKPLFHFWPGSSSFSISTVGCSFKCPWCQNYHISQAEPGDVFANELEPEKIVELTEKYGCKSISYTYNEPTIWHEYVLDTARLAKREGILNVLVTNGYITPEALSEIAGFIDAANVDVKGFNEKFYRTYCKAELRPVLDAVEEMKRKGIHVETTTLIIPNLNDNPKEITELSKWHIEKLGLDTPIHFSRFYPTYKLNITPPTPTEIIARSRNIAANEGIRYVYVGNLPGDPGENTYCPFCKQLLVERQGYDISQWHVTEDNRCQKCRKPIPIVGTYERRPPRLSRLIIS